MSFELSSDQFCKMILYDWKIALTYKECHARLVQAWGEGATHLPITQCLIGFVNFNAINLAFKVLLA